MFTPFVAYCKCGWVFPRLIQACSSLEWMRECPVCHVPLKWKQSPGGMFSSDRRESV